MGARHELNRLHLLGSLGLAGFLGLLAGSWSVFVTSAAVLIGLAVYAGEIRPRGRRHR